MFYFCFTSFYIRIKHLCSMLIAQWRRIIPFKPEFEDPLIMATLTFIKIYMIILLFSVGRHTFNSIICCNCKLDVTDEFDIKEQAFHIEQLELGYWGDHSGWKNNIDGLEILIKAVANSSLKHSLNKILIWEIKMDIEYKDKIKEIFERHNLQDVLG